MKANQEKGARVVYLSERVRHALRSYGDSARISETSLPACPDPSAAVPEELVAQGIRPLALASGCAVAALLLLVAQVPMLGSLPAAYDTPQFAVTALVAIATLVMLLSRLQAFEAERRAHELQRKIDKRTEELSRRTDELLEAVRQKAEVINELRRASDAYEREAHEDALTGLANRRHFDAVAADWFASCRRTRRPIAAALVDLDHFKRVNDDCSHAAGDAVLRKVAELIREQCSEVAICARYGGEEFALLFPNCKAEAAARFCESLRQAFERSDMDAIQVGLRVTLSAGVADDPEADSHERLLALADHMLYRAKRAGRNRVHS